jgi:hypothetical protein
MKFNFTADTILEGETTVTMEFESNVDDIISSELQSIVEGKYDVFAVYEVENEIESYLVIEGINRIFSIKDTMGIYLKHAKSSIFYVQRRLTEGERMNINYIKKQTK